MAPLKNSRAFQVKESVVLYYTSDTELVLTIWEKSKSREKFTVHANKLSVLKYPTRPYRNLSTSIELQ
jgi:hypothetical protein